MRMIFVNLPVKDLEASKRFYEALGFSINPDYTDETAACVVISETIFVMILTESKFRQFIVNEISDAANTTEMINALSVESREQADAMLEKALAAGGKAWKPVMEEGPMYSTSFQDLDGHVWEPIYMDLG